MKNKVKNLKKIFLDKFHYFLEIIKNNPLYKKLAKYIPYFLIPLFILYIIISLKNSEINIFNYKTLTSISIYLISAFFISPIFILLTSIRFHFLKLILESKTTIYKSINSVLLASSLDAFTPAKVNDFARLRNEPNKKISIYAIFIERFLDILVLTCFAFYFTNKSYSLLENQKVIEALSMDLDEDIHELEERLIVIEAFVKDIDEDVHSLRK